MIRFCKNLHFLFLMRRGKLRRPPGASLGGPLKGFVHGHGRRSTRLTLMSEISPVTPKVKVIKAFQLDQLFGGTARDSQA